MSAIHLLKRVSALVIAFVTLSTLSAHASTPPGAQLGLVSAGGSLTSGSDLNYKFDLNVVTNAGPLVVKATISGRRFRAKFPVLTISNPSLGVSDDVPGTSVHIPDSFTGVTVMHVTATFNGKKIGSQTFLVTITAPLPPAPLTVTTNLYDVGFENPVTLDGSIVPTSGLTGTLTYAWSQTSGKTVTLSTNGVVSTSFTTDALTNFVQTGTSIFVNDIDDQGFTNSLYVAPEHRFGTVAGLALDNQQATAATYGFKLLVTAGSVTRTGLFTVACSIQTPAHPNIPLGVSAFYKGATSSTNWSLVSKPAGSTATLNHTNGLIAELRPDVEGVYIVQDNVTAKIVTNTAASWTGVQFCNICHGPDSNVGQDDMVTPWSQTKHATKLQRELDGVQGAYYAESCIKCHSVGYNKAPAAANGGFDDVQAAVGWIFPSTRLPGTYTNGVPDALKAVSNIQCENCHGPGSRHPGSPSISLDVKVCATCHQDGSHHVRPQQWEISPHAGAFENISNSSSPKRGNRKDCARCHSPVGFTALAKGEVDFSTGTNSVPTGVGPLPCQACHDPHNTFGDPDRHQLRVYDSALFGNPYFRSNNVYVALGDSLTTADLRLTNSNLIVTNAGASAACLVCHNGRQLPTQQILYGTSNVGSNYYQVGGPHDQLAGEAFTGVGAYDYGQVMGNSFHTYLASCQTCHMYQLKAGDTITTNDVPVVITSGNLATYANVVGNHTFKMDYVSVSGGVTNVVDNIAACNQCHASFEPVESFDFQPANGHDYDGNSTVEGIQTETEGLMANLAYLLMWGNGGTNGIWATTNATAGIAVPLTLVTNKVAGVTNSVVSATGTSLVTSFSSTAAYYSTNAAVAEAQRKAVWNWLLAYREGSFGVHNTQYIIRLLQTTYTDLSTNYYGDVNKTYQNDFPNAFLR